MTIYSSFTKNFHRVIAYSILYLTTQTHCILQHIPSIDQNQAYHAVRNNLSLRAQLFTHHDCLHYFGVDLIKKGYRPLLCEFTNLSGSTFTFHPSYLAAAPRSIAHPSKKEIFSLLTFSPGWYLCGVLQLVITFYWKLLRVPMVLTVLSMLNYNRTIQQKLNNLLFDPDDPFTIKPYERISKLIFIPEEYFCSYFYISLLDNRSTTLLTFDVDLLQKISARKKHVYLPGLVLL